MGIRRHRLCAESITSVLEVVVGLSRSPTQQWQRKCCDIVNSYNTVQKMMPRPCIRCCSTLFKGRLRRSYFYGANKATTKIPPYLGPCSAPIASLAEPAEKYQPVTDLIVYIHKTERERSSESSYTPPLVSLPSKPVGDGQWFRWTQQRTRNGQSPYMKYIKKVEEVDKYVAKLLGPGLAMDMEWNVNGRCDVDLLQICSEDLILLVHLSEMGTISSSCLVLMSRIIPRIIESCH